MTNASMFWANGSVIRKRITVMEANDSRINAL
jgi:hypothetical protein